MSKKKNGRFQPETTILPISKTFTDRLRFSYIIHFSSRIVKRPRNGSYIFFFLEKLTSFDVLAGCGVSDEMSSDFYLSLSAFDNAFHFFKSFDVHASEVHSERISGVHISFLEIKLLQH